MSAIIDQMHNRSNTMTWVHAYAEWAEINAEYQEALADNRNGESFFPTDLSEAEYRAEQAASRAWEEVENQRAGRRVAGQVGALQVAPLLMCQELRAEWQAAGGI